MTEVEQALLAVRDVYVNYPKQIKLITEAYTKTCSERQDLLHIIELGNLDAVGMSRIYKALRAVQKERRKLKDELELLQSVKDLIDAKRPTENRINHAIGRVREVKTKQKTRSYRMRVRTDLQDLIKGGAT